MGIPLSNKPLLSAFDRISPVWTAIDKHLNERIEVLRSKNDGDLDQIETAKIRGRIAELRAMLDLGKEPIDIN